MWNIFGSRKAGGQGRRRPYEVVRFGRLEAWVWRNRTEDGEPYFRVTLARVSGRGERKVRGKGFYPDDLLAFPRLLQGLATTLAAEETLPPRLRRQHAELAELLEVLLPLSEEERANGKAVNPGTRRAG